MVRVSGSPPICSLPSTFLVQILAQNVLEVSNLVNMSSSTTCISQSHFLYISDSSLPNYDVCPGSSEPALGFRQWGLYTPRYIPYGMGGIQPHSMDSIWTIFWLATQPFFHSIPTMESIWNPYGMDHSMDIPCASPCGFLVDSMEFPMNLHCKFMYYSIWIPWNSPYGFHWRIHIKFHGKTIKNWTVNSTTHHVWE